MASNEVEVLDPAAPVEKLPETASGSTLNRRNFMAALGAAGVAAAGIGLMSSEPGAEAQLPAQNGYNQSDVLNFLLNIKYLKATFYAWLTAGVDLPDSLTVGSGAIYAIPQGTVANHIPANPAAGASSKLVPVATASAGSPVTQKVLDMLTEIYYDELQQVIDLRNLISSLSVTPINRPALNIQGNMQTINTGTTAAPVLVTGYIGTTTTVVTFSITQNLALGIARLLEDLSATAFAYAAQYLSGTNLAYATQILASDGLHAGALRLICIQNQVPYLATQSSGSTYSSTGVVTTTNFAASTTSGSNVVYGIASTATVTNTFPSVGQIITGTGIPTNTTVTAVTSPNGATSAVVSGILVSQSNIITLVNLNSDPNYWGTPVNVGSTGTDKKNPPLYLAIGQPVTGTGTSIPANAYITGVTSSTSATTPSTITISSPATVTTSVAPTGVVNNGSAIITGLSSVAGLTPGQAVTLSSPYTSLLKPGFNTSTAGSFSTGATILTINANNTVTMSAAANATSTFTFQGYTTSGSSTITLASGLVNGVLTTSLTNGLIDGQSITGTGIPANTTILNFNSTTVLLSAPATVTSGTTLATSVALTTPTTTTITTATTESITIGTGSITLSNPATATGCPVYLSAYTADNNDVAPGDNGTASINGPAVYSATSPAIYQAFFNTAGTATASGETAAGFAFARTFSQVLQVLYNGTTTTTTQVTSGGFFPSGVQGIINAV